MERDVPHTTGSAGPPTEGWNTSGKPEGSSGRSEKDKKDKKKEANQPPKSAAVEAWQRLIKGNEAAHVPKDNVLEFPSGRAKAAATTESQKKPDKPAEVISLDEHRQAKAAVEENQLPQTGQPEYPIAVGAEPPLAPPPLAAWMQSGNRGPQQPEMRGHDNRDKPRASDGNSSGEQPAGSEAPAAYSEFEQKAAMAPIGGEALGQADAGDVATETVGSEFPPTHETFQVAETELASDNIPLPATNPEAVLQTDPGHPDIFDRPASAVPKPTGYERTTADVSRAAWTGLIVGWFIGRRNKNKAIDRAVTAVERRFKKSRPAVSTAPSASRHYEAPSSTATTARQEAVSPAWLRGETTSTAANRLSAERLSAAPLAEMLAMPAAAVAIRILAERRQSTGSAESLSAASGIRSETSLADSQLVALAKTIKVDGIPLHQIYEARQIDKEGLRAVVEAYLRGGNVEKQLTQEVIEKQKMFERDPFNRKRARSSGSGLRGAVSQASGKLIDKSSNFAQSSQKMAGKVGHAVVGSAQKAQENIAEGSDSRNWAGIVAVVIIYSLILLLLLTK